MALKFLTLLITCLFTSRCPLVNTSDWVRHLFKSSGIIPNLQVSTIFPLPLKVLEFCLFFPFIVIFVFFHFTLSGNIHSLSFHSSCIGYLHWRSSDKMSPKYSEFDFPFFFLFYSHELKEHKHHCLNRSSNIMTLYLNTTVNDINFHAASYFERNTSVNLTGWESLSTGNWARY